MSTVSTFELLDNLIDSRMRGLRVALPARVDAYDPEAQTVDVTPCLSSIVPQGEDVAPVVDRLPSIPAVPVVFPRAGGFYLTFPLSAGDFVLLVISDADIGRWMSLGGVHVAPGDVRPHGLSGAVALPGLYPSPRALPSTDAGALVLGSEGGLAVRVTDERLEVGGSGDAAALASRVEALEAAVSQHTHTVTGGATGIPLYNPGFPLPSGYASEKLKVDS